MFFNLFSNLHVAHGPRCLRSVEVPLVWLLWALSGYCHWSVEVLVFRPGCTQEAGSGKRWGLLVMRRGDQHRAGAQLVSCMREHRLWVHTFEDCPGSATWSKSVNVSELTAFCEVGSSYFAHCSWVDYVSWGYVKCLECFRINRVMAVVVIMVPVCCFDTVR